ncbi:hypothetical protein KKC91_06950 [bacterium]|nr:hypothetical protein [bacterium]
MLITRSRVFTVLVVSLMMLTCGTTMTTSAESLTKKNETRITKQQNKEIKGLIKRAKVQYKGEHYENVVDLCKQVLNTNLENGKALNKKALKLKVKAEAKLNKIKEQAKKEAAKNKEAEKQKKEKAKQALIENLMNQARQKMKSNEYDFVIALCDEVLKIDDSEIETVKLKEKAKTALKEKKEEERQRQEQETKINKERAIRSYLDQAKAEYKNKNYKKAERAAEHVLQIDRSNKKAKSIWTKSDSRLEDISGKEEKEASRIKIRTLKSELKLAWEQKKYKEVVEICNLLHENVPGDSMATKYERKAKDNLAKQMVAKRLMASTEEKEEKQRELDGYVTEAIEKYKKKDYAGARDAAKKALEIDKDNDIVLPIYIKANRRADMAGPGVVKEKDTTGAVPVSKPKKDKAMREEIEGKEDKLEFKKEDIKDAQSDALSENADIKAKIKEIDDSGQLQAPAPPTSVKRPDMDRWTGLIDEVDQAKTEVSKPEFNITVEKLEKSVSLRCMDVELQKLLETLLSDEFVLVLGEGVSTKKLISINVKEQPLGSVLTSVVTPLGYSWKVRRDKIVVFAFDTKTFRVVLPSLAHGFINKISNETETKETESGSGSETTKTKAKIGATITVQTEVEDMSVWDEIDANLKSFISEKGKYIVNKGAGLIIVKDYGYILDNIAQYITNVNRELSRQVLLEVKLIDVSLSHTKETGIDWGAITKKVSALGVGNLTISGNFTDAVSNGFVLNAQGPNAGSGDSRRGIQTLIKLLEEQGEVSILSQPKQMVLNNQPAVIQVGRIVTYIASSTRSVTDTGESYTIETSDVQEGITMFVVARINESGEIYVNISPVLTTIEQIRQIQMGGTTIEAPEQTIRAMTTTVRIRNGDTIILGGLISKDKKYTDQSVPFFNRIPFIGKAFGYTERDVTRSELVIMITPIIVS